MPHIIDFLLGKIHLSKTVLKYAQSKEIKGLVQGITRFFFKMFFLKKKKAIENYHSLQICENKFSPSTYSRFREVFKANSDSIATDITNQMGKPKAQAVGEVRTMLAR